MQDRDIKDTSAKRQDDVFLSGLLSGGIETKRQ